tara:strand:- start:84205 stop:84837 length:633 start_codon:yes stop_codon:yes gene_type:complete
MSRIALLIWAALALTSCKPEISSNTYFCGPDSLCPPGLACQLGDNGSFAYNCVSANEVRDFSCPSQTADVEPDDEAGQAREMGEIGCGEQLQFDDWGCIEDATDVDTFEFIRPTECNGSNPHTRVTLRAPLGAAPLGIELLDEAGQVLTTGELCTTQQDQTGTEQVCIENGDLAPGTYRLRIFVNDAANADCDGTCAFNHYQLVIASPLT